MANVANHLVSAMRKQPDRQRRGRAEHVHDHVRTRVDLAARLVDPKALAEDADHLDGEIDDETANGDKSNSWALLACVPLPNILDVITGQPQAACFWSLTYLLSYCPLCGIRGRIAIVGRFCPGALKTRREIY
jgi:hypothetical protein